MVGRDICLYAGMTFLGVGRSCLFGTGDMASYITLCRALTKTCSAGSTVQESLKTHINQLPRTKIMKQRGRIFAVTTFSPLMLAVLMAAAAEGASAQPAVNTVPSTSGQASTESQSGVPNPTQRPDGSMPASRSAIKSEARAQNKDSANSDTPMGQASTMRDGQPNATPQPMSRTTRQEVRQTARQTRRPMGVKGEQPNVPTNPPTADGTPK